jgi:hypothetical protein
MKKTYSILMIALLVTALVACKKDKDDKDPNKDLKSSWELAEYSTSWLPKIIYNPGNGNLLHFGADTYTVFKDGQIKEQGNYTAKADNTVEQNSCDPSLKDIYTRSIEFTYGDSTRITYKRFYYIADDKLYFVSGCHAVDGRVDAVYRRVKPMPVD